MASIQNLLSLPGQTAANASVMAAPRSIVPGTEATPYAPEGALTTIELSGDALSVGFENIMETVLANASGANAIELKTSPDLTAFFNSSFFSSANSESLSLLTTTAMSQVRQSATAPMLDLLLAMQALQPAQPSTADMPTKNAGAGNIETDVQGGANPALAISTPIMDGLTETVWPAPQTIEQVAGAFASGATQLTQPADPTVAPTRDVDATPAPHAAAFVDPGVPLQTVPIYVAADANRVTPIVSKTGLVSAPALEQNSTPLPNSVADAASVFTPRPDIATRQADTTNTMPPLTLNVTPPVMSHASSDLPRGMPDEAGNAVGDNKSDSPGATMKTVVNNQSQLEPINLYPGQTSQPTASLAPVPAIASASLQPDLVGKKLIAASGDTVTPVNRPGELHSPKRSIAGIRDEGLSPVDTQVDAPPTLLTSETSPQNAIPQSTTGAPPQTPEQRAPSSLMVAPSPQPLATVSDASSLSEPQDQPASGTGPRGDDQPTMRNIAVPQPQATASATPTPGQNATAAQPTAADGQNFVQTLEQISGTTPHAAQPASQPDSPDMVQGAIGNTAQIDRQDMLRSALPQATPRSDPNPSHISPPIRDISVHISQHVDTGMNRFQLRLDPPELGRVDVRMEISPEGKLSAVIAVERPETLDLLQRDSRALERSLMEAGLKTDSNSLSFSLKGGGRENQDTDGSRPGQGGSGNELTDEWDEPIAPVAIRFANRSVNIRI